MGVLKIEVCGFDIAFQSMRIIGIIDIVVVLVDSLVTAIAYVWLRNDVNIVKSMSRSCRRCSR